MRRLARALLSAMLPPGDDWAAEFVATLDEEADERAARGGEWSAGLWYGRQLLRPSTLRFVARVRRRARGATGSATPGAAPHAASGAASGTPPRSASGPLQALAEVTIDAGRDVRHAARSLRRDPRVTLFVGATLAVGIGGVTALHDVADRLFLSGPPHVERPDELVRLYLEVPDPRGTRTSPLIPYATALAIDQRVTSFRAATLHRGEATLVRTGARTEPASVSFTDLDYFRVLRARPESGRAYGPADEADRAVAVVSAGFARERGGLDVGGAIEVGDRALTIVGVAPHGFAGAGVERIDVWTPLDLDAAGSRNWRVVARLPEGRTPDVVQAEAQAVHLTQDPGRFFQWAREGEIGVAGLERDLEGNRTMERSIALLLLSVVALVLVVAWVNVLNLLLARLVRRRQELGVRVALGIGRLRLARQLLLETGLLGVLGALLALPIAWGAGRLVRGVLLPDVAWADGAVGGDDVLLALGIGAVTAVLLGALVFPAIRRPASMSLLGTGRATAGGSTLRLQRALATAQVAMSTGLLLCAALFARSFWAMKGTDLGVDADRVYTVDLRALDRDIWSSNQADSVHVRALERVREADPTTRWALTVGLPLAASFSISVHVAERDSIPVLPGGGPFVSMVSDGYFATTGTRLVQGRDLAPDAAELGLREIVIGASTVDALWPGEDALDRCIRIDGPDTPCWTVVGVAEDVNRQGYREPPSIQIYVPLGATPQFGGATLLARPGVGGPGVRRLGGGISATARAELIASDPRVDFVEVRRLDSLLSAEIRPWRLGATMLSLAAGLAVAISLAGVLAVLSYLVAQRRREIGVRLALGAGRDAIRSLVLRQGLWTGAIGAALGIAAVLLSARWIGPLLFETRVLDPLLLLGVGAGVAGVSTLACLSPARSATRIDPVETLRASD